MTDQVKKHSGIEKRTVHDVGELVKVNDDAIVSRTLMNSPAGSLTLFAFAEGQQLSEHTSPFDACVHVLEGAAEIAIDGQPFDVEAGQMIVMPADIPHAVNARHPFVMLLTMFRGAA